MLEPVHAPLDYIAPPVGSCVEARMPSRAFGPSLALVTPLGDGVWDAPSPQQTPATREAVPPVCDKVLGPLARPARSPEARHPYGVQHRRQLRAFVTLTRGDDDRERATFPVTGEVQLGAQAPSAVPERLVGRVGDPLFESSRLGARRAPAAC